MKTRGGNNNKNLKSNSTLAIAAGCAVAFMFIVTIFSVSYYQHSIKDASQLLASSDLESFDSYVVFISSDDDSDYWQSVYQAAAAEGRKNGIYVDKISDSINEDYTKAQYLEMAIDSGCDGIILEGDTTEEVARLLEKASAKDIDVVLLQTDQPDSSRITYVGLNNYYEAQLYAAQIKDALKEETSVMVFESADADESATGILVTGIQEALSSYETNDAQVSFETKTIDNEDAFATEEFVQNFFQNEELPDVIICLDELTTTCVYQAMIDYNKVGSVVLLGNYQSDTIFEGISQGVINSTVSTDTKGMGQVAVDAFLEYDKTGYVSDYYGVDTFLIDKSNVDQIKSEVADE